MDAIKPVPDALFRLDTYNEAYWKCTNCPGELSDLELAHVAVYDQRKARQAAEARCKALERPAALALAPPRQQQAWTSADDDGLADVIAETAVAAVRTLHPRIDALDARITGLESSVGALRDGSWHSPDLEQLTVRVRTLEKSGDLIVAHSERLAALEGRPVGMEFKGPYQPGTRYQKGDVVQWHGDAWCAMCETWGQPDAADESGRRGWKMIVRRGRDGKPCREPQ